MDYTKKSREELLALCKEKGIKGYSAKKKNELVELLVAKEVPDVSKEPVAVEATGLRMIDLFAGTGAFTHAFQSTGQVKCVFANDMVEWSKTIYDANFDHKLTLKNLNDIPVEDIPGHDILTGGFPCFVAGTKVLTEDGYKAIETVSLEDKLLTHTGKYQTILNRQVKGGVTRVQGVQIMYHPYSIDATDEHPFYVKERVKTWNAGLRKYDYTFTAPMWVNAKELHDSHYVAMPRNTKDVVPSFECNKCVNKTTKNTVNLVLNQTDQWYMMGYFLGDGWIEDTKKDDGRSNYSIRFSIADKDKETVLPILSRVLPIQTKQKRSGACETYGCGSQEWFEVLAQFGKYCHGKMIPEWVHDAPVNFVEAFLEGYAKADGSVCPSSRGIPNHHVSYTTVSHNIAFGIQRLYAKLGMLCSVDYTERPPTTIIEGREVNQRNTYRMRVVLNRERQGSALIEEEHIWLKVKSVEEKTLEAQPVYNFEVEHDNSYCVENAVVHNCQPFSIAGRQEGFQDERSNVFWKILSIIDHHKPKCVVLENVKNLVSHDEKRTFETIKTQLETRGYHIRFKVLNTADITGVPQHRERIYIVCFKDKSLYEKFSLDFPAIPKRGVQTCLEESVPGKYYYKDSSSTWPLLSEAVKKRNTIYQYRRVYVRENKSQECPTLTANMGGGGHNVPIILDEKGIRKLTPRETFNFQGFPYSYTLPTLSDTNLYKLAGNAVSVPVVELIAKRLVPLLASSG